MTKVLAERGKRYGEFEDQAKYVQAIKELYHTSGNWTKMEDDQREALDMIANKIGRILNGDPNYDDNWVDIAGYAKLVADRLQKEAKRAEADKEAKRQEEIRKYNEEADHYLTEGLQQGRRLQTGPYPSPGDVAPMDRGAVLGILAKRTES